MRKKHISSVLVATAAALSVSQASAAVIASDNFNGYSLGSLAGQGAPGSGWAGSWTGSSSVSVVNTNQPSDAPMSGRALRLTEPDAENAATRQLSSPINSNVWVDFLFQFDAGTIQNNDFMALWFGGLTGPNIGLKANCGDGTVAGATAPNGAPCALDLFVRLGQSDGVYSTNINVGQTYRIVGLLAKTGSAATAYNRFSMWVDPSNAELSNGTGIDAFASAPGGAAGSGSTSLVSFNTIGFRVANLDPIATSGATTNWDRLLVDNLSLHDSAPLRVPEPGALALAGLALGLAGAATRRRRQT